ncbi:MAG: prefoldin subunit alpha [Nanoarchaeota archaeon]
MKDDQQILQQKFLEFQLLQQHLETIQQQIQLLNQQNLELTKLKDSLSDLENSKQGQKIFSQLGPGIFVKADLKQIDEVLFNIGSDILVNKSIKDAISIFDSQQKDIIKSNMELEGQFRKIVSRVIELQEDIQKLKK